MSVTFRGFLTKSQYDKEFDEIITILGKKLTDQEVKATKMWFIQEVEKMQQINQPDDPRIKYYKKLEEEVLSRLPDEVRHLVSISYYTYYTYIDTGAEKTSLEELKEQLHCTLCPASDDFCVHLKDYFIHSCKMDIADFALDDVVDSEDFDTYFVQDRKNAEGLLQAVINLTLFQTEKDTLDDCFSRLGFTKEKTARWMKRIDFFQSANKAYLTMLDRQKIPEELKEVAKMMHNSFIEGFTSRKKTDTLKSFLSWRYFNVGSEFLTLKTYLLHFIHNPVASYVDIFSEKPAETKKIILYHGLFFVIINDLVSYERDLKDGIENLFVKIGQAYSITKEESVFRIMTLARRLIEGIRLFEKKSELQSLVSSVLTDISGLMFIHFTHERYQDDMKSILDLTVRNRVEAFL